MIRRAATVVAVMVACVSPAAAQDGFMGWFEGGKQHTEFGNGLKRDGVAAGGGFQLIIGGGAQKDSGLVVPVGMELKYSQGLDWVFSGDVGIRVRNVSFGPGGTFNLMSRNYVDDPRCKTKSIYPLNSCVNTTTGLRDVGGFYGLAPSFFVRGNFGPQGRAFVQMRYFKYVSGFLSFLSDSELRESFNVLAASMGSNAQATQNTAAFHPVDFPEFKGGSDARFSAGYVVGENGHVIIRGQFSTKQFDFTRVLANDNGLFNQKTKQFTFGIGFR